MKTSVRQLAEAFYQAVRRQPPAEAKLMAANFARLIRQTGRLKQLPLIIDHLERCWERESGEAIVNIESARELSRESLQQLKLTLARRLGCRTVKPVQRLNKSLLGGVVISHGDKVIDASLKTIIGELRQKLVC